MKSKGKKALQLFFDFPTRHWSFCELLEGSKMARSKLSRWLKVFRAESLIKRIKERGRFPYYTSDHESVFYRNRKRFHALELLHGSGFLDHLASLDAELVIIFGSFSRWDWYEKSDIDLFIFGSTERLELAKYQDLLNREIHIFSATDKADLEKLGKGLCENIMRGFVVKGDLGLMMDV